MDKMSDDCKKIITPTNAFENISFYHKTPLVNNTTKEKGLLVMRQPNLNMWKDETKEKYKTPQKIALVKTLKPLILIPLRVCIFNGAPYSFWFS